MALAKNPILPGFNPDPSIVRVDDDYYIATSTFEWFPGVQIHHSRDLVNWRLLTRPLDEKRLLDMRGNPASGGIWAPCLSYANGLFWLIYTDHKNFSNGMDCPNYLTTAATIEGPWSDPVFLNAGGFDPSLFHDEDGRKWLVNMIVDFRPGKSMFGGIVLQEYDPQAKRLMGQRKKIFSGTKFGLTEGPHLYKRNGFYYLWVAEGGTGMTHAETVARSRNIEGPYELSPHHPLLSSRDHSDAPLQKAGHASYVETLDGHGYLVHLCGRPINHEDEPKKRCTLGRETAIQRVVWDNDGWPMLAHGTPVPAEEVTIPDIEPHPFPPEPTQFEFDEPVLPICFQSLREPVDSSWASLTERPGKLVMRGRKSLTSTFDQSLLARRIQHFDTDISTVVEFDPLHFQHMAGLVVYYGPQTWFYLMVTHEEEIGRCLDFHHLRRGTRRARIGDTPAPLPDGPVHLRFELRKRTLQASWSTDGHTWTKVGEPQDLTVVSDECNDWGFTGAMAGMCVQDLDRYERKAAFDRFSYEPIGS